MTLPFLLPGRSFSTGAARMNPQHSRSNRRESGTGFQPVGGSAGRRPPPAPATGYKPVLLYSLSSGFFSFRLRRKIPRASASETPSIK
jgi:hypothetical protein